KVRRRHHSQNLPGKRSKDSRHSECKCQDEFLHRAKSLVESRPVSAIVERGKFGEQHIVDWPCEKENHTGNSEADGIYAYLLESKKVTNDILVGAERKCGCEHTWQERQ